MSGVGANTIVGAKGTSSISGGSGVSGHHLASRGAFSFDSVAVGGKHLIGSIVAGAHSITSGHAIGGAHKPATGHGGHTQISLDHGKTLIHIKHGHH